MDRNLFEQKYTGQAPWDIGQPQSAIVMLQESGQIRGAVLDVGCGSGENVLYLASKGYAAWGLDFVPVAIDRAKAKATERGIKAQFQVGNALALNKFGLTFDTAIDCGLFHTFSDEERPVYVAGLRFVLRPRGQVHILCFSDEEPAGEGPRRVSQLELRRAFDIGWTIQRIEAARFDTLEGPGQPRFSPGGPKAWLVSIERT